MTRNRTTKVKNRVLLAIVIFFFVAVIGATYARYMSTGTVNTSANIAKWNVKLNNELLEDDTSVDVIATKVVGVSNDNVTNGKIAPGQTLGATFEVDPSGSEVAIDYIVSVGTITTQGFNTNSTITLSRIEATVDGTTTELGGANSQFTFFESLEDVLAGNEVEFTAYVYWEDGNNVADTANGAGEVTEVVVPINVVARQHLASDGFISYTDSSTTLMAAAAAINEGDTLTLTENITYDDYAQYPTGSHFRAEFADNATLDLAGHTVTAPNGAIAYVGDNLTIKNGTFVGLISSAEGRYGIQVWDDNNTHDYSEGVVIENVTTTGVCLYNAEVTLRNVTSTVPDDAKYYAVYGNVYTKITIESGTYTAGTKTTALLGYCLSDGSEAGVVTPDGKNPVDGFVIKGGTFITNGKPLYLNNSSHGAPVIQGGSFDIDVTSLIDTSEYQCNYNSVTGYYDVTEI